MISLPPAMTDTTLVPIPKKFGHCGSSDFAHCRHQIHEYKKPVKVISLNIKCLVFALCSTDYMLNRQEGHSLGSEVTWRLIGNQ